jgi:hypothetical protein
MPVAACSSLNKPAEGERKAINPRMQAKPTDLGRLSFCVSEQFTLCFPQLVSQLVDTPVQSVHAFVPSASNNQIMSLSPGPPPPQSTSLYHIPPVLNIYQKTKIAI